MLEVRGLTLRVGGRTLCRDLDFILGKGELCAVRSAVLPPHRYCYRAVYDLGRLFNISGQGCVAGLSKALQHGHALLTGAPRRAVWGVA